MFLLGTTKLTEKAVKFASAFPNIEAKEGCTEGKKPWIPWSFPPETAREQARTMASASARSIHQGAGRENRGRSGEINW